MNIKLKSSKLLTVMAAGVLFAIILAGVLAPHLAPFNPFQPDMANRLQAPSTIHWLGTDALGRDMLSRMLFGSRSTIILSFISTLLALSVGTIIGLVGGYYGGRVDSFLTAVTNIFQGVPSTAFMIAIAGFYGPSIKGLIIALVIASWAGFSRIVRAEVMRIRRLDFIEVLTSLGASDSRIIFRHILPQLFSNILVLASMRLGRGILAIASLSFLGLGVQPPTPDWSVMISDALLYYRGYPHLVIVPTLAILALVASINIIGRTLRDYFDIRLEELR